MQESDILLERVHSAFSVKVAWGKERTPWLQQGTRSSCVVVISTRKQSYVRVAKSNCARPVLSFVV